ncbi:1-acyl-sn-glycerol-3-phosphate acyltransferase [Neolewinella litorea]|uniref:Phospholipid/glycerol acyltransferase domain-containing protein n=1 Tax=Neolewinella litorea TaxID=2562452 RepID=A0A4V3XLJ5_9BACT|nr:1-acyl-sn-glycerol-3-phosphate acyltransferase [Neolewinella litorea]THH41183.1 hypothetical protein E4021_00880 [Neolewinella litorea]
MLYYLVRPVARYVLSYYYRNIDITGLDHIPRDAPVILAANHPTAFIEPCLLACFQSRTLHFLARGDLFRSTVATLVLRALNMLPVYRIQDGGYDKLVRNYDTFDECYTALSQHRALMILAEGRCIHEKRLRPLRKGTARIALGALDRDNTLREVYIVPVGVNFTAADQTRSKVMIRCGEPLLASRYLSEYRKQEMTAMRSLTDDLRTALSTLVVQLPDGVDVAAFDTVLETRDHAAARGQRGITHSGKTLDAELATSSGALPDMAGTLRYAARLKKHGLRDDDVAPPMTSAIKMPLTALPAAVLLLPQLPGWLLAETIALRGPKTVEFYSPVRFAAIAVITLLYLPAVFFLPWPVAVWLILSLLTVRWALRKVEDWLDWRGHRKFMQLSVAEREELQRMREALL